MGSSPVSRAVDGRSGRSFLEDLADVFDLVGEEVVHTTMSPGLSVGAGPWRRQVREAAPSIEPSITQGAPILSTRRAAMKIVVFQ